MPRYSGALIVFLLLLAGEPAEAIETTFDDAYIIDLHPGWQARMLEPGYTMFSSPDQKAVFLITTGHSMTKHREMVAPMLQRYDHLRVGAPDLYVSLMRIQTQRVAVTVIGDHPDRVKTYWSIKPVASASTRMRDQWGGRALDNK